MGKPNYTDSFVAFIDILGFKEFSSQTDAVTMYNFFEDITNFSDLLLKSNNHIMTPDMLKTVTINIISDSIVYSVPKSTKRSLEILVLLIDTVVLNILGKYKLFCRGGIASGDFFSDNNLAFGPALVKAYMLESNLAEYPRIILTRDTFEQYLSAEGTQTINDFYELACLYSDEQLIIADYIGFSLLRLSSEVYNNRSNTFIVNNFYAGIREKVEDELVKQTNKKIREKLLWFREYYNQSIIKFRSKYDMPFECAFILGDEYRDMFYEVTPEGTIM